MPSPEPSEAHTGRSEVSAVPEAAPTALVRPGASEPPKPKLGRPKGYPKTGGRQKGADTAIGKEGRQWLAKNSKALDVLARVASGKPVRIAGPTGKKLWHYPSWSDQKWACELLLPRLVPTLTAAEISGPDGAPIQTEALLPLEQMQRLGHLFAAHQAQQPAAPPGEPAPPVIDVEAETIAAPEDREGGGGATQPAAAACADD